MVLVEALVAMILIVGIVLLAIGHLDAVQARYRQTRSTMRQSDIWTRAMIPYVDLWGSGYPIGWVQDFQIDTVNVHVNVLADPRIHRARLYEFVFTDATAAALAPMDTVRVSVSGFLTMEFAQPSANDMRP